MELSRLNAEEQAFGKKGNILSDIGKVRIFKVVRNSTCYNCQGLCMYIYNTLYICC
jgi:hypothetical protein